MVWVQGFLVRPGKSLSVARVRLEEDSSGCITSRVRLDLDASIFQLDSPMKEIRGCVGSRRGC